MRSVPLLLILLSGFLWSAARARDIRSAGTFRIYVNGQLAGREAYSVTRTDAGMEWTGDAALELRSLSVHIKKFALTTDTRFRPLSLEVDATVGSAEQEIRTTFAEGGARSEIRVAGARSTKDDAVSADALVLLSSVPFFAYEVLAQRVDLSQMGEQEFRAYIVPQVEIPVRVRVKGRERLEFAARAADVIRLELTLVHPTGYTVSMEMWVTDERHMVKLLIPGPLMIEVSREGYEEKVEGPGPTPYEALEVTFPSGSLVLAGTLTLPRERSGPLPAVVLIAGSGPHERDQVVAGVRIFEQIADHLTRRGVAVLRYDKRGVGRSQGEFATATIYDFADDARAAVDFLRSRSEIAADRIALVGHSEGALVALLVAVRDPSLKAIVLMGGPATRGEQLVLEQQEYLLKKLNLSERERHERIALQKRILEAAKTSRGWEEIERGLPPEARPQLQMARSPWFREFLRLDPLPLLERLACPILVLHGGKDTQVFPYHAEIFARALEKLTKVPHAVKVFPALNHLFQRAETGDISEYGRLGTQLDPEFLEVLTSWLLQQVTGTSIGR